MSLLGLIKLGLIKVQIWGQNTGIAESHALMYTINYIITYIMFRYNGDNNFILYRICKFAHLQRSEQFVAYFVLN